MKGKEVPSPSISDEEYDELARKEGRPTIAQMEEVLQQFFAEGGSVNFGGDLPSDPTEMIGLLETIYKTVHDKEID